MSASDAMDKVLRKLNINSEYGNLSTIIDQMSYKDTYKQRQGDAPYAAICPMCKQRMFTPGFIHVWMIVRRSDVLDVKENNLHPILMHKECATQYEVTKRLLISAGAIPEDH